MEFIDQFAYIILVFSFLLCAFCSASETGIMSLNRYKLKHLAKTEAYAKRVLELLSHPERLLGAILIGNTLATAICASIIHALAEKAWGDLGVLAAPIIATLLLLIFAEVMPKTLAVLKPEKTARFVSIPLQFMLGLLYPFVRLANGLSNTLLRLCGLKLSNKVLDSVTYEELRTIVNEAGSYIPNRHQRMLISILDLEQVRVEQVMVPRNEVTGIDLEDDLSAIIEQLQSLQHTLLPVYQADLDNVQGILHTRNVVRLLAEKNLDKEIIIHAMEEPYFVPEGTSLQAQLLHFQQNKRRMALVVDEYGDVLGLLTLEDILEEIVGEFTTDVQSIEPDVQAQTDGSFLVDGSMGIRELNRSQQWHLPLKGPTTLNGLITETLESLPVEGLCVLIGGYPIEVVHMKENAVKLARIYPRIVGDSS